MKTEIVKKKLTIAIGLLLENDLFLLENNVNERSVSHKLAEYLQLLFKDWHVDCEYNRDYDKVKKLHFASSQSENTDSLDAKTVFPDIIIHHRNTDDNLLVVEMKKCGNSQGDDFDKKKLKAYICELNYKCGCFVKFESSGKYEVEWFQSKQQTLPL